MRLWNPFRRKPAPGPLVWMTISYSGQLTEQPKVHLSLSCSRPKFVSSTTLLTEPKTGTGEAYIEYRARHLRQMLDIPVYDERKPA